jgi:hypothetical protein
MSHSLHVVKGIIVHSRVGVHVKEVLTLTRNVDLQGPSSR